MCEGNTAFPDGTPSYFFAGHIRHTRHCLFSHGLPPLLHGAPIAKRARVPARKKNTIMLCIFQTRLPMHPLKRHSSASLPGHQGSLFCFASTANDSLITAFIPNSNKILLDFLCHIIYLSWESKKSVKRRSARGKVCPFLPLALQAFITPDSIPALFYLFSIL